MLAVLAAAAPAAGQDKALPGAKLLHKFPNEVYRIPALLETQQGPRLLVWVDAYDPSPIPKFPADPIPNPKFDLIFWDVKANKEANKLAYPQDDAPLSPVPTGMTSPYLVGVFGKLALSPDGKKLASISHTYKIIPGKPIHEPTSHIKVYDWATGKWTPAHSFAGRDGPHILFAPDGALVILKEKWWAIQEIGQPKPRGLFKLTRSPLYVPQPSGALVYEIRNAVLTPDGAHLAVATDGLVTVYDTKSGAVEVQAERAAPDNKGFTNAQNTLVADLAFSPSGKDPVLLSVETVTGAPKSFVLARLFDVKTKKETSRRVLAEEAAKVVGIGGGALPPAWTRTASYFNTKGEPRVLLNGKLFDAASGKVLHTFDGGYSVLVARDGQYMVRLTQKSGDKRFGVELWSLDNTL